MSFFNKNKKTPREEIKSSRKKIGKLGKKRYKLDKKYKDEPNNEVYQEKRQSLNSKMRYEYKMIDDYELELTHPAKVSKSTTFAPQIKFSPKTEHSVNVHFHRKHKKKQ